MDNLMLHQAIYAAEPGSIIVAEVNRGYEGGYWGEIMTIAAQQRKIAGLVIDGCVRDGATIRELGFPIFARGLNMKGTVKMRLGAVGVPITCAGVAVAPGDAVVGDDDGVVVVPRALIATVAQAGREREDKEAAMRAKLEAGATTVELLGLRPLLRTGG
jgi:4-hydroxy-4-methyl-2-oxoglutarate aldolase